MAQNIFWNSDSKVERILAFDIPVSRAFMHLDTVFTQIDVDKFTIHPAIMGTLRVYELTAGKNPGDVNIRLIEDTLEHVLEDATGVDQVKLIPCGRSRPPASSGTTAPTPCASSPARSASTPATPSPTTCCTRRAWTFSSCPPPSSPAAAAARAA